MFNVYDGCLNYRFCIVLLDCLENSSYDMVYFLLGEGQ